MYNLLKRPKQAGFTFVPQFLDWLVLRAVVSFVTISSVPTLLSLPFNALLLATEAIFIISFSLKSCFNLIAWAAELFDTWVVLELAETGAVFLSHALTHSMAPCFT